jgi:hypothetical protein
LSTPSGGRGRGRKVAQTSQRQPITRKPPLPARKRPAAMAW